MANFAIINNNIVENIILADTKETAEVATGKTCIEYTEENPAVIGLGWSQELGFEQPLIPELTELEKTVITEEE